MQVCHLPLMQWVDSIKDSTEVTERAIGVLALVLTGSCRWQTKPVVWMVVPFLSL
jgi:hypothetical protein